jgi:hypothetical protein
MGPAGPVGPSLIKAVGSVTTDALTTKGGEKHIVQVADAAITPASFIWPSLKNGTNTAGWPVVLSVTPGEGQAAVEVANMHAKDDFNGTLEITLMVINA